MATRNPTGIFSQIFADVGDVAPPPFPIVDGFGALYSIPVTSGGLAPERTTINFLYNALYALGVDVNRFGGALLWDASITYEIGAVVIGLDDKTYQAKAVSIGIVPAQPSTFWTELRNADDLQDPTSSGSGLVGYTNPFVGVAVTVEDNLDLLVKDQILVSTIIQNRVIVGTSRGVDSVVSEAYGVTINFLASTFSDADYRVLVSADTSPGDIRQMTTACVREGSALTGSVEIQIAHIDAGSAVSSPDQRFYIEIKPSIATLPLLALVAKNNLLSTRAKAVDKALEKRHAHALIVVKNRADHFNNTAVKSFDGSQTRLARLKTEAIQTKSGVRPRSIEEKDKIDGLLKHNERLMRTIKDEFEASQKSILDGATPKLNKGKENCIHKLIKENEKRICEIKKALADKQAEQDAQRGAKKKEPGVNKSAE